MNLNKVLLSAATVVGFTAATVATANADTVTVNAGDTLSHIALRNNTTVEALQQLNNLENINLIFPGQKIEVGGQTQTVEQTPVVVAQPAQPAQADQTQQVAQAQAKAAVEAQQAAQAQAAAAAQAQAQQAAQAAAVQQAAQGQSYTVTQQPTTSIAGNGDETAAREWIAGKESGGSYTVTNGQYIGKYQLSASYLNGDYSAENQERVANNYVSSRYGSWTNAKQHWLQNGWY
ncbi:LysM peptidoglycan-binding domain-containing protein [Ligilactobacillus murinus]|uniref:LysM peptidoglycan-binding domain-containing protein n=1 Tax=Ligilactobacillus murinus TaxID=1622 RepID=A0AAE6WGM8_9LACO|nr:LysM domain-containing protein [Ligilactobacillus murinus]NEF82364.1 LysM peptidoglycan-binding domain-containing protein [Ligilactobacillus murinus]NEF86949.1 LysM peptidoglycan-binding domain-containing protein [Ligilactobacillus murinus]NEF89210.1 LysM peptidoglycan-binding domain-containing protein [Ligilactobacillus murinus]NEF91452.1 LysM peptidoglycan-binding domain-containing protein [Ligilactobacillus murinus]NEF98285.1 LysM peptidoglycan-binding domain-containing protein [Ligilact